MMSRMSADTFLIDVYGTYLTGDAHSEFEDCQLFDHDSRGKLLDRVKQPDRMSAETCTLTHPTRRLRYIVPRLIWLAIGPGALMVLAVLKLEARSGASETLDAVFFAIAAAILMLRWGTWIAGDHCDSFGSRMTMNGLLGFSVLLAATAGAVWYLAALIAQQH